MFVPLESPLLLCKNFVGLKAISNYVTIAHITVLLVALTAAKNGMKDKVRFIKSFLPNFNP